MSQTLSKLLPALLLLATAATALAEPASEVEDLRQRLEKLEARHEEPEGFTIATGKKILTLSGEVEVNASYTDTVNRAGDSKVTVKTAQINFDAAVSDRVKGRIALLHEDGTDPTVNIDEAYVAVTRPETLGGTAKITAGRAYLPFGAFTSVMVSDPLTLDLGEIRQNAILSGWENGKVAFQLAAFNGDRDTSSHDVIDNGVAALTFTPNEQISFGTSYLCDLAETKAKILADATAPYEKNVNAASAFLTLKFAPVTVTVEYLGALREFSQALLADPKKSPDLSGGKPRAWFAEVGYAPSKDWAVSCRYEKAKDFKDDVARYGATGSYGIDVNTTLSLEYLHSDFARATEARANLITVQLAVEF